MTSVAAQSPRVAPVRDSDVPALMKFFDEFWAKSHILSRDEALLRWQYDASLRDGVDAPPSVLLAWDGDRIVGMIGLTYMRWRQGGCAHLGAWNSHWFVLPEMRASHLALNLLRRVAQSGAEVIGSVGVNDAALRVLRHLGYEVLPEIPRWVAVIAPGKTAALILASGIAPTREDEVREVCRQRASIARVDSEGRGLWPVVEWTDDVAPAWDSCWQHRIAMTFTGVERDAAYIRWRYLEHPSFRYNVRLARHPVSGEVGGIAVFRLETVRGRAERVLRVLDLLASDRAATDSLLAELLREARDADVAFVDFYCTKAIDGLEEAGFQREQLEDNSFPIPFRLQPLEAGGRPLNAAIRLPHALRGTLVELAKHGSLYVTKADGDQDRPN